MTIAPTPRFAAAIGLLLACALPAGLRAQEVAVVNGVVTSQLGMPLGGARVTVKGHGLTIATSQNGRFVLRRVPTGRQVLDVRMLGYAPREVTVDITGSASVMVNITLERQPVALGAVLIQGASLAPDRLIEAPAAVSVVHLSPADPLSLTGQVPLTLARVPGLDVVVSGVNDFNVNARGFNSVQNRGLPVYQDGRDLTLGLQGNQVWTTLSEPLEDLGRIEVIRGPASALYGANAFKGVISITTPLARDIVGTKVTLGGGSRRTVRADVRHAGVLGEDRFGYRINAGYTESQDWTVSRTALDGSDWKQEYAEATSVPPTSPARERLPLAGQIIDSVTGRALGTPHPLLNVYGSARLDYYGANSITTVEAGTTRAENSINLTANGRNQLIGLARPWARFAWEGSGNSLSAWFTGRRGRQNYRLNSGLTNYNHQNIFSLETRTNRTFGGDAGRLVMGASLRQDEENTKGTILGAANDDRSDRAYGAYAQLDYAITRALHVTGAARWDFGDLFKSQRSPKLAFVFMPASNHAIRLGASRAFLTPTPIALFQASATGPGVQDLSSIEAALRSDPAVGPALAAVAAGALFTNSSAVPQLALGNPLLVPQSVVSYEAGYKGQFGSGLFLTLDTWSARVRDFTTPLLPAGTTRLNPAFDPWTAPEQVPFSDRAKVESAVLQALTARGNTVRNGLTRVSDGSTAVVLSYGNAGTVDQWGVDVGAAVTVSETLALTSTWSLFTSAVRENVAGNVLSANTPRNKGTVALSYAGRRGLTIDVDARFVERYHWISGIYDGEVPAAQTVNLSAGYRVNPNVRMTLAATNVLDQQRFQIYGGAVVGRRIVVGATSTF